MGHNCQNSVPLDIIILHCLIKECCVLPRGPSTKCVMYFWSILTPPVTLCHTSRDPPKVRYTSRTPRLLVGLVQKPDKCPLYKFSLNCSRGFCSGDFVRGVFCLEGFVWGDFYPFHLLSEYTCYDRKLNITLNFMFHMYNKKFISVTSHALYPLPRSQTVKPSRTPSSRQA